MDAEKKKKEQEAGLYIKYKFTYTKREVFDSTLCYEHDEHFPTYRPYIKMAYNRKHFSFAFLLT